MNGFKNLSIKNKIILIILAVTVSTYSAASIILIIYARAEARDDLVKELRLASRLTGGNAASAIAFDDSMAAMEFLRSLRSFPTVAAAAVYDENNVLFATYRNPESPRVAIPENSPIANEVFINRKYVSVVEPINYDNVNYGYIFIIADKTPIGKKTAKYALFTALLGAVAFGLAAALAALLRKPIADPIIHLADAAGEIKESNDYSTRVLKRGEDEIGKLYDDFNAMLEMIEKRENEKNAAIAALRNSEQKHRALFESMAQGVVYQDSKGSITSVNPATEEILGLDYGSLYGKSLSEAIGKAMNEDGSNLDKEMFPDVVARRTGKSVKNQILGIFNEKTKTYRWISANSAPYFKTGTNEPYQIYTTLNDFTDRKKAETEREKLNKELIDKNSELEQIVYVASHDLRSPLVNIQGFSSELQISIEETAELAMGLDMPESTRKELTEYFEVDIPVSIGYVVSSIRRMDALIKGLLRLSRLGRAALNVKELNMNILAKDAARAFQYLAQNNNAELQIEDLPNCFGDENFVNRALGNLIENALKFLKPDEPGRIVVKGYKLDSSSIYCVEDNGVGIKEEHTDKIFEIFNRLNPEASEGEGLGLSVVKKIMERLDGSVWLESEYGIGSKFYFSLPNSTTKE